MSLTQTPQFRAAHAGLPLLTTHQSKVLDYCAAHMLQNQCLPTGSDLAAAFGWKSNNASHTMLKILQNIGYLEAIESETGCTKNKANRLRFARMQIQFIGEPALVGSGE